MPGVAFTHPQLGSLIIENGIDAAQWAYGLNTATFPTYGGEVVQILSVFIDNLTIAGTVTTYEQANAIYRYFAGYLQTATQGKVAGAASQAGDSTDSGAYNLEPITFTYLERNWSFDIYPISVPGFEYGFDVVAPTWRIEAFVVDDAQDLGLIKDGIKALATTGGVPDDGSGVLDTFSITGQISPLYGDPNTDPFQTYDSSISDQQKLIGRYSNYYNTLIPAYAQGDFSAITGVAGSKPAFGQTSNQNNGAIAGSTVTVPAPKKGAKGTTPTPSGTSGTSGSSSPSNLAPSTPFARGGGNLDWAAISLPKGIFNDLYLALLRQYPGDRNSSGLVSSTPIPQNVHDYLRYAAFISTQMTEGQIKKYKVFFWWVYYWHASGSKATQIANAVN